MRKINVTAIQSLLVPNRQQTHDWTLIGSGANGIGIPVWVALKLMKELGPMEEIKIQKSPFIDANSNSNIFYLLKIIISVKYNSPLYLGSISRINV